MKELNHQPKLLPFTKLLMPLSVIGLGLLVAGCESAGHHGQRDGGAYNREMHMEEQSERGALIELQPTEDFADVPEVFNENLDETFTELREQPDFSNLDVVAAPIFSNQNSLFRLRRQQGRACHSKR